MADKIADSKTNESKIASTRSFLRIPSELIGDARLSASAKTLYMTLCQTGPCSICELAAASKMNRETIRRQVAALSKAGWIIISGSATRKRLAATRPDSVQREMAQYLRTIRPALNPVGESLFKLILDVVVADDRYVDNARPHFLQHPRTLEYMELDRWYYERQIGGEYEGSIHHMLTGITDQKRLDEIRERDALKIEMCRERNIPLIIVSEDDLSIEGVLKKLPPEAPRAYFDPKDKYLRALDEICEEYVALCRRARGRDKRKDERQRDELAESAGGAEFLSRPG